jgi:hypothetical protein
MTDKTLCSYHYCHCLKPYDRECPIKHSLSLAVSDTLDCTKRILKRYCQYWGSPATKQDYDIIRTKCFIPSRKNYPWDKSTPI